MVDIRYFEKLNLTCKEDHRLYSIDKNEISNVGPFSPEELLWTFMMNESDGLWGFWRIVLKSGRIFDAEGSIKDYDKVVKVILCKKI